MLCSVTELERRILSVNELEGLLNNLALELTLASDGDADIVSNSRKILASVCASDLASSKRQIMKLSKELIRLTHVMDGGGEQETKSGMPILLDGVSLLQNMVGGNIPSAEKESEMTSDLKVRIDGIMSDGDARPVKKAKKSSAKKKAPVVESAPVNASDAQDSGEANDKDSMPPAAAAEHEIEETVTLTEPITDDPDLFAEFLTEAGDHLQSAEGSLLELEATPDSVDAIDTVFRAYHTIKGVAGFLGLMDINRLTHDAETLLDTCRKGNLHINSTIIDLAFETIDAIRCLLAVVGERVDGNHADISNLPDLIALRKKLQRAADGDFSFVDSSVEESFPNPSPVGEILLGGGAISVEQLESALGKQQVREPTKAIGEILMQDAGVPLRTVAGAIREQKPAASGRKGAGAAVKVDTEKLDLLVNMVGELVIAQTQVAQGSLLIQSRDEKLSKDLTHLNKITKDIQEVAMSMRMIPVRDTFNKMARLVRDLSRKAGKQIDFRISGEDTEVDRNMVEEIGDPLVHILRNSVDHGIASPEDREEAGKPATGTIDLNAFHQGGNIVIEIRDDGNGLNRDKILSKAIEKGLVRDGDQISDAQIFQLIFNAGFSTADKITDISGRGVGMDVVRQNVEKLRGKVEVSSELGAGTTIQLKLPLTLAIIDGMIVKVGVERYIVPTISIVETLRPEKGEIFGVTGKAEMISVRGNLYPLIKLYETFHVKPKTADTSEALVVIVESDSGRCCLQVDELLGQQQVVIKSLGEQLRGIRGLSGGAILADGRVGLILDVSSLVQVALSKVDDTVLVAEKI